MARRSLACTLTPLPLVSGVTHCLADAGLEPRHEKPIESEVSATLSLEEPAHVLGVAIGTRDQRRALDRIAVPVEGFHRRSSSRLLTMVRTATYRSTHLIGLEGSSHGAQAGARFRYAPLRAIRKRQLDCAN